MAAGDYYFSTGYSYNIFDADEHLCVFLMREKKNGGYKQLSVWSYSTFMQSSLANFRAESRIKRLRKVYGAIPLPQ